MPKPLQAAASFGGIPDVMGAGDVSFGREIEVQEGIPMDGSNSVLRTYSPFLIRVVLPYILGGDQSDQLVTFQNPQRSSSSQTAPTVRTDNRNGTSYSQSQNDVRVNPSGREAYDNLVNAGGAVPGLTTASQTALEDAYNQAIFQQQFGPTVQNVTRPPTSQRTNSVTPGVTNDTYALSLAVQLKQLSSVPPLLLLINPGSMQVSYNKVAQFQNRNRYGFVYEAWGEEMPKISFTFKIGAYTAGLSSVTQNGSVVTGVQRASRNDSAAFQQLMNMLALFQSGAYLQDLEGSSRAFPMVGNLAIEYDQMVYIGHMESFSFGEEETKQHGGLDIQVEFVANKVFDLAPQVGDVLPMQGPNSPQNRNTRGALQRTGRGNSLSFVTTPTVGGDSALAGTVNQAWESATGTQTGAQTGVNLETGVITTRRR